MRILGSLKSFVSKLRPRSEEQEAVIELPDGMKILTLETSGPTTGGSKSSTMVELFKFADGRSAVVEVSNAEHAIRPVVLTKTDLQSRVRDSADPVVVEVCSLIDGMIVTGPILEKVKERCNRRATFIRTGSVEILEERHLPTVLVFYRGTLVERFTGNESEGIAGCLERL